MAPYHPLRLQGFIHIFLGTIYMFSPVSTTNEIIDISPMTPTFKYLASPLFFPIEYSI